MQTRDVDFCIIGAGIVGLATAVRLIAREPGAKVLVLEKEAEVARHQTGHNSGVIHAGVYYHPGSLKARLCTQGMKATKKFCLANGIRFDTCGKLIVATNSTELGRMEELADRASENGVRIERLSSAQLHMREPNIVGVGALHVPDTGIVDYREVCKAMASKIEDAGGAVLFGAMVRSIDEGDDGVVVGLDKGPSFKAGRLIACAGLQSDRLACMAGAESRHRIVPFRGEYYVLSPRRSNVVKHLIYPVPDPELPFLGIHLTRMIDGSITVGPNAVLGLARENYSKFSFDVHDASEVISFRGFWPLAAKHWRSAISEFGSSISRRKYLKACQKYCPSLTLSDLSTSFAGIRAQAVLADGTLVHDFLFASTARTLHVCNAPSPAATSALPIAEMIIDQITQ